MATAQKEPSLIQKDLLASKLVESNFYLLETEELPRLDRPDELDLRPKLDKLDRSEATYRLLEAVLCNIVRVT